MTKLSTKIDTDKATAYINSEKETHAKMPIMIMNLDKVEWDELKSNLKSFVGSLGSLDDVQSENLHELIMSNIRETTPETESPKLVYLSNYMTIANIQYFENISEYVTTAEQFTTSRYIKTFFEETLARKDFGDKLFSERLGFWSTMTKPEDRSTKCVVLTLKSLRGDIGKVLEAIKGRDFGYVSGIIEDVKNKWMTAFDELSAAEESIRESEDEMIDIVTQGEPITYDDFKVLAKMKGYTDKSKLEELYNVVGVEFNRLNGYRYTGETTNTPIFSSQLFHDLFNKEIKSRIKYYLEDKRVNTIYSLSQMKKLLMLSALNNKSDENASFNVKNVEDQAKHSLVEVELFDNDSFLDLFTE